MAVIDFLCPEIGVFKVMVGNQVLVEAEFHITGNRHMVLEMEDHIGLCPKGSEFVNFMKVGTVRREHPVITGTHDFRFH